MFIVMHCAGMPFNGETINSSSLGGSETSAYYLAKELARKGHSVTLFTNSQKEGVWDGVKYIWAGNTNQNTPLGDRFHFYAEGTPHDVLIIQRHLAAFRYNWAAKVKLWHLHDLAQIRFRDEAGAHLWNIDGVLTVSEFHKAQVCEAWGINPEVVLPIQNGVDLSLFEGDIEEGGEFDFNNYEGIGNKIKLLYTSRPERGLEYLVMPDGIMERLAKIDDRYHLYVCGYSNTTEQMAPYYNYLWQRCDQLPNVTNLGPLTKKNLADVMRQCNVLVYPTPGPQQPDFEEVSCITAMEAMAAGLPFISSDKGALSETCKDSGSILIPLNKEGMPDINEFVNTIEYYEDDPEDVLRINQLESAKQYSWDKAADMIVGHVEQLFNKNRSAGAVAKQLMLNSDIYALRQFQSREELRSPIETAINAELNQCYKFALYDKWEKHYDDYYTYEAARGVEYGPESLEGNNRFEHVSSIIAGLDDGSVVLDYGCAHGHYTINLAKRFPKIHFVGIDITLSNVEKATKWAAEEGVENAEFIHGRVDTGKGDIQVLNKRDERVSLSSMYRYDAIIAAEVLEHVGTPQEHAAVLCGYLKNNGTMAITTPFGPWEAIGYQEHWPWRAHVWHFDRADLHNMWGHFPAFNVTVAPSGGSKWGIPLGSYITTFKKPGNGSISMSKIDLDRKFREISPIQTVSLCMIVKDAEDTLKRSLDSAKAIADEVIIALDETTSDGTQVIIDNWIKDRKGIWPVVKQIRIKSPLEIGFDEARNLSIAEASGDWIMWLDSDEILIHPENVFKYLRNNCYHGYAIKQHHFAVEPLGVLKTDLPCRLFRNHRGVKFLGVIHEHPEKDMNSGVGYVQLLHDVEIAHQGYTTEEVRRRRFHRNIALLVRDREKNPDRILGKFLWLRDLAQMCQYELERNGNRVTNEMVNRAKEGMVIWEELIELNQLRMVVDSMSFYNILAKILGEGFDFAMALDSSKLNGGTHLERSQPIASYFHSKDHVEKLFLALANDKVKDYGRLYY